MNTKLLFLSMDYGEHKKYLGTPEDRIQASFFLAKVLDET